MVEAGDVVGLYLGGNKGGFEVEAKRQHGHRVLYYTTDEAASGPLTVSLESRHVHGIDRSAKWKDLVPLIDFSSMLSTQIK